MAMSLTACVAQSNQTANPAPRPAAATSAKDIFARDFLNRLQPNSIAQNREYCGYFFKDAAGRLHASPPRLGLETNCILQHPPPGGSVYASYHTHGASSTSHDKEVPSAKDLQADFDLNINGYIATPGGRVWRTNAATRDAVQVCGIGCIAGDPRFNAGADQDIVTRYDLATLRQRYAR
jgi:hypothetical protein